MTPPKGPKTENEVIEVVIPEVNVNTSPSKIVTALDWRFSSVLSEIPLLEDNPCFKINPEDAPTPPVTVNVLTFGTVSTI